MLVLCRPSELKLTYHKEDGTTVEFELNMNAPGSLIAERICPSNTYHQVLKTSQCAERERMFADSNCDSYEFTYTDRDHKLSTHTVQALHCIASADCIRTLIFLNLNDTTCIRPWYSNVQRVD